MLGNGRIEVSCFDGIKRMGHIRGKLRKKVWMGQGDIILVSLRDFQDDQCDVVHKYNSDEARTLKNVGELPENARLMKLIPLVLMMMKRSISNSVEPMKMNLKRMKSWILTIFRSKWFCQREERERKVAYNFYCTLLYM